MKKFMKMKLDMNVIVMIIIIAAMSAVGVYYMENEWIEWMTGVIWLVGEMMIIGVLAFKPVMKFIMEETTKIYTKMLED